MPAQASTSRVVRLLTIFGLGAAMLGGGCGDSDGDGGLVGADSNRHDLFLIQMSNIGAPSPLPLYPTAGTLHGGGDRYYAVGQIGKDAAVAAVRDGKEAVWARRYLTASGATLLGARALDDGLLMFLALDAKQRLGVARIDGDGEIAWSSSYAAVEGLTLCDDDSISGPCNRRIPVSEIVDGKIAVGFGRHVFRIDVATGDLVWLSAVAATVYGIAQDTEGIYIAANYPQDSLSVLRLDHDGALVHAYVGQPLPQKQGSLMGYPAQMRVRHIFANGDGTLTLGYEIVDDYLIRTNAVAQLDRDGVFLKSTVYAQFRNHPTFVGSTTISSPIEYSPVHELRAVGDGTYFSDGIISDIHGAGVNTLIHMDAAGRPLSHRYLYTAEALPGLMLPGGSYRRLVLGGSSVFIDAASECSMIIGGPDDLAIQELAVDHVGEDHSPPLTSTIEAADVQPLALEPLVIGASIESTQNQCGS